MRCDEGSAWAKFTAEAAGRALWEVDELPLERVEHEHLIHVAWELRDNFSFYDALYVALALMLDEPLLTFDARLARVGGRSADRGRSRSGSRRRRGSRRRAPRRGGSRA